MKKLRLAILDLYNNVPNQGMRCIKDIVRRFESSVDWELYDIRGKAQTPDLVDYDIFISTGGPGSPHDGDGVWDKKYYDWLGNVWDWNRSNLHDKKHVFLICHSFQMACKYFALGQVTRRKSMSFGTFKCHMTNLGAVDPLFDGLPDPFYIADFRDWQVVQPDQERFEEMGAQILALEKIRPHVPLERAVMAIRFSDEIVGTQFHPEADPDGMLQHFLDPERRRKIIDDHSQEKYLRMIDHLNDSDKIALTHEIVLPSFLDRAIRRLQPERIPA